MNMPWTQQQINDAQKEVLRANKLDSAYLRPMVFFGSEGMGLRASGLKTHVIVGAWTWGAYLGADNMERGIRIKTSSRSEEHTSELQSLMRISYAVFCFKKTKTNNR